MPIARKRSVRPYPGASPVVVPARSSAVLWLGRRRFFRSTERRPWQDTAEGGGQNHADVKPPSRLRGFPRPQEPEAAPTADRLGEPEGKGTHQGGGTERIPPSEHDGPLPRAASSALATLGRFGSYVFGRSRGRTGGDGSSGIACAIPPSTPLGCDKDRGVARFGRIDRSVQDVSSRPDILSTFVTLDS